MEDDFRFTTLPVIGKRVLRLGLACNFGIDSTGVERALLDQGIGYVYWTPRMGRATAALRRALARDRERFVVATGPTTTWWTGNLRRFVDKALRVLDTDYLDTLQLHWLGVTAWWRKPIVEELVGLRESGRVHAIGISIHNRPLAGSLAASSPLDVLMVRYNAAHPGAELDIFPNIRPERHTVVAYTATSWRQLLRRPRGFNGELPTAGHCYRFCLSHPKVDVVLTGPRSSTELDENLAALSLGPLSREEMAWMRELGHLVRG